jgi:hypothetical protein
MEFLIRLTRISPTHHRFAYTRPDGSGEELEFETKSFLFHDLLHFAVETEAGLKNSFYGKLLKGELYAKLMEEPPRLEDTQEIAHTERIVGGLTSVIKQGKDASAFISTMQNLFSAYGEELPGYLTETFIQNVQERMRRLQGEWQALPFGETMEIRFSY